MAQLAFNVVLLPEQIGLGLALAVVGAAGVAVTFIVTFVAGLLQVLLTQAA